VFLAKIKQNKSQKISGDNARKFISETIEPNFLVKNKATISHLTIDWIYTNGNKEVKIVLCKPEDGRTQYRRITKFSRGMNRTSIREIINKKEYISLKRSSKICIKKRRCKFHFFQDGSKFIIHYDEFINSKFRIIEVDFANEDRKQVSFDSHRFPYKLREVSRIVKFSGYRVARQLLIRCTPSRRSVILSR
jgi:hypothetical protein